MRLTRTHFCSIKVSLSWKSNKNRRYAIENDSGHVLVLFSIFSSIIICKTIWLLSCWAEIMEEKTPGEENESFKINIVHTCRIQMNVLFSISFVQVLINLRFQYIPVAQFHQIFQQLSSFSTIIYCHRH
jgi:hypothetical protein